MVNNAPMNKIEKYRLEKGLSYDAMSIAVGIRKSAIWRHCHGLSMVRPESVLLYEAALGIPRHELRPDIWEPPTQISELPHAPQA